MDFFEKPGREAGFHLVGGSADRVERSSRANQVDQSDRVEQIDQIERVAKQTEQAEQAEQTEQTEQTGESARQPSPSPGFARSASCKQAGKLASSRRAAKPTPLFAGYAARMAFRLVLFAAAAVAFAWAPDQLSPARSFGVSGGFDLIDLVFLAIAADMLTKFFPSAKISMGSLKQYGEFHVPTARMFKDGREGVRSYVRDMVTQGKIAVERIPGQLPAQIRTAWEETRAGTLDSLKVLVRSIDFLRVVPFKEEQLTAAEEARNQIRADRLREIAPVAVFWVLFNALAALLLARFALLNEQTVLMWTLFYFLFDMVCVVLWCPIQLLLMRNRCCTTCQIFNWDAIMAVTPLVFLLPDLRTAWFVWPLLALGLVVLLRWELAFARHPERFDERTNASLSCANCKDRLCYLRNPLEHKLSELPGLGRASALSPSASSAPCRAASPSGSSLSALSPSIVSSDDAVSPSDRPL